MLFLEQVALSVLQKAVHFDMPQGILPVFRNATFAFATPGAEDPDLNITGEGFALKGAMDWLGHELGSMDVAVGPTSGIFAKGKIDDMNIGPLHLRDNDFTLKAPLKTLPSLKLDSDIAFLGIKERFHVDFSKKGVKFKAHMTLGPDFIADMDVVLSGVNLSAKKPSFSKADFYVAGDFEAKIADFLKHGMKQLAEDVKKELNAKFEQGKKQIAKAKSKVDGLNKKINHERAVVRAEKQKAERKIKAAEDRVNRIKGDLDHAWHKYHHCHGWGKIACKIEWGIAIAGEKAALRIADGVLEAAEGLIEHVPLDFDPRIWPLIAAKDSAMVTLDAAEKSIDGLEDLDGAIASILSKIANAAGHVMDLNINKASFQGDLRGIIEHDTPVDLGLDVTLFGARFADQFAFKLKDMPYNAEQLALMGIYGLDHLINKELKKLPAAMRHQLHAVLGRRMDAAQATARRELAKYGKDFNQYQKTAATIKDAYAREAESFARTLIKSKVTLLDKEPPSRKLDEAVIEIAHSGLCVYNSPESYQGMTQWPCEHPHKAGYQPYYGNSGNALKYQKVSTATVMDGKKDTGYVQITQAGKCLELEGTWKNTEVKFANGMTGFEETLTPKGVSFTTCKKGDTRQNWKILDHGSRYTQIVNRASNQCLAFNSWGNVPGNGKVTFDACTGGDTQVFRVVDYAPLIYFPVKTVIKHLASNACMTPLGNVTKDQLRWGNEVGVEFKECDGETAQQFDFMTDYLGRRKFIHKASGGCLNTRQDYDGLQIGACTNDETMYFAPLPGPGGNAYQTAIGNDGQQPTCLTMEDQAVRATACGFKPNQMFVVPTSWNVGAEWKRVQGGSGISGSWNASFTPAEQAVSAIFAEAAKNQHIRSVLVGQAGEMLKGVPGCLGPGKDCYIVKPPSQGYQSQKRVFYTAEDYTGRSRYIYARPGLGKYDVASATKALVDDLTPQGQAAVKARSNTKVAAEPKWYICRTGVWQGLESWLQGGANIRVGFVDNRQCVVMNDNYGGEMTYERQYEYEVLTGGGGLQWKRSGGGFIPETALQLGEIPNQANNAIDFVYSCRAMVKRKTVVGFTTDGMACWTKTPFNEYYSSDQRMAAIQNFEVLSVDTSVKLPPPPNPPLPTPPRGKGPGETEKQVCRNSAWRGKICKECIFTQWGSIDYCWSKQGDVNYGTFGDNNVF